MIRWLTITPSSSVPASTWQIHDATRGGQRTNQVQFNEERLRNGISPAAVAGVIVLLAQLEAQTTLPCMAVSIVADVAQWSMRWLRITTSLHG